MSLSLHFIYYKMLGLWFSPFLDNVILSERGNMTKVDQQHILVKSIFCSVDILHFLFAWNVPPVFLFDT